MDADLQTFCLDDLAELDAAELQQPWDDNPDVTGPEVDPRRQLAGDLSFINATRRTCVDWRTNPDAYKHLSILPKEGESLHGVISGRYALWDLVPALLAHHAPATIEQLHLATLGFSLSNATDIIDLYDRGRIKRISLLVSHYFKGTSPQIYDALIPKLREREQPVLAMRTHCKIILARFSSGETYTVESSANLRSCKNIEQFVLTRDAALYEFQQGWMDGLLEGKE